MPRGDGTGPRGMGPMTGRGAGYCAGYPSPGFMNPMGGRMGLGLGRGRGFGYGRGRGGYAGYGMGMPYASPYAFGSTAGYGSPYGGGYTPYYGGYAQPYGYGQPGGAVPGTGPFGPAMTEEEAQKQELEFLRNQTKTLKDQMDGINSRIKELDSKKKE